jgi:hypothetical protein
LLDNAKGRQYQPFDRTGHDAAALAQKTLPLHQLQPCVVKSLKETTLEGFTRTLASLISSHQLLNEKRTAGDGKIANLSPVTIGPFVQRPGRLVVLKVPAASLLSLLQGDIPTPIWLLLNDKDTRLIHWLTWRLLPLFTNNSRACCQSFRM